MKRVGLPTTATRSVCWLSYLIVALSRQTLLTQKSRPVSLAA
jgi:hypothetical protein